MGSIPAYAVAPPAALHAQPPAPAPLFLFNVPSRIPILRAPTPHSLLTPIVQAGPINHAAIMGLKRTWESAFPTDTPSTVAKRATWHAPATAFAQAPAAAPGLPYPAQFYPQL